jgi:hypothetical protein
MYQFKYELFKKYDRFLLTFPQQFTFCFNTNGCHHPVFFTFVPWQIAQFRVFYFY